MRQYHLDSAVARVTGESLHTIQQRGFGLVRMDSQRPKRRQSSPNPNAYAQATSAESTADNLACYGSDC